MELDPRDPREQARLALAHAKIEINDALDHEALVALHDAVDRILEFLVSGVPQTFEVPASDPEAEP